MTVTGPELRQLRYFVAVAEELSFTKAAERLMIAQQSLSAQIAVLERRLGVRLLDRGARGTRLSAVGVAFLPEAREVLERVDQAMTVARRASQGEVGSVRLAFLTTVKRQASPGDRREQGVCSVRLELGQVDPTGRITLPNPQDFLIPLDGPNTFETGVFVGVGPIQQD